MPELLPKGKIIHMPPRLLFTYRNSQVVAKAIHTSPDKYHTIWQGKKGIWSPYTLIRAQNTPPTHTPCFCSLQKWAVKDQQYCFLWEEGKGSQMQIFLCGGEGDKTSPRPKKPPLGFRHVLGDNS